MNNLGGSWRRFKASKGKIFSRRKMAAEDKTWDDMLQLAKIIQQDLYECLPGWTKYMESEYRFLKQNIGFAIFGPPPSEERDLVLERAAAEMINATDILEYTSEQRKTIDNIFEKLRVYETIGEEKYILYEVIFNTVFRPKDPSKKTTGKAESDQEDPIDIRTIPIFKVASGDAQKFIDLHGRVYKDFQDYITNNTLHKCTMVLPKGGYYQPDPAEPLTAESSSVWVMVEDSPACSTMRNVLFGIDVVSCAAGFGALGVGVASVFTPVGPIVMGTTAVAMAFNAVWTVGRASENLVNRAMHEQSINVTDTEALSAWLGIASAATGFASSTSATLLANAARRGQNIGQVARLTHDALMIGSIVVSGIGIGYQGYSIYSRYQENQTIDLMDLAFFGAHLLFFGNTIINVQSAESLIQSTQAKVLNDYKSGLRSKNLRKKYNKVVRRAQANSSNTLEQNAEVIQYINNRADLMKGQFGFLRPDIAVKFENHVVTINGVEIFEPKEFVIRFMAKFVREVNRQPENDEEDGLVYSSEYNNELIELRNLCAILLSRLYDEFGVDEVDRSPVTSFDAILRTIARLYNGSRDILEQIFKVLTRIIHRSRPLLRFIVDLVHLLWGYFRENLTRNAVRSSNGVRRVWRALEKVLCMLIEEICTAFNIYAERSHINYS